MADTKPQAWPEPQAPFDPQASLDPQRRLLLFLLVSAALHGLWLALPLPQPAAGSRPPPLRVQLLPSHEHTARSEAPPPIAASNERSGVAVRRLHPETPLPAVPAVVPEAAVAAPTVSIDLDAARASARAYARSAPTAPTAPAASTNTAHLPLTVERAIARATEPDEVIESRGANGEYITETKHMRCVTPLSVPHYQQGMMIPAQCQAKKG